MGDRVLIDLYYTMPPRWGWGGDAWSDLIGFTPYPELCRTFGAAFPLLFRPVGTIFKSLLPVLLI